MLISHRICRFFQSGSCQKGDRYKFLHSVSASNGGSDSQTSTTDRPRQISRAAHNSHLAPTASYQRGQSDEGLQNWKRLLKLGSEQRRLSAFTVSQFFQQGLRLIEAEDVGSSQHATRELAKEEGLGFIKNAVDTQVALIGENFTQARLLTTIMVPLFRWVTHPRVVDSAVLEQEVSIIFNFMLGVGGRRITTLFNFVIGALDSWPAINANELTRMEMLELSLNVLSKILDCNTSNIVNDAFNPLADKLASLLACENADESYSNLQAKRFMRYIKVRLDVGVEIPSQQEHRPAPVTREQFVLSRDLPGELSADGPRHDNDHADIDDIKIMPTAQEIMSPRAEYLPTTNSTEWHRSGIKGRLDREFRLLREDTVGQLRDTARAMLEMVRNPAQRPSQHSRNNARTFVYDFPAPREVSFQQPSGLEILVEFAQPQVIRNLNLRQRQEWWQNCKHLQEGALVSVLDVTGSVLFFEVSDSTLRTGEDKMKKWHNPRKHGDGSQDEGDEKKLSLGDDAKRSFVSLRLVDPDRHAVTQTLRWYRNVGPSLRRYLVEFPGVLLASFKHTLEALQEISRQPRLPFTDLIAPPDTSSQDAHIDLPLYARQPGFTYDLSCLSVDRQALEISARDLRSQSTLELVTSRTLLDTTQSSAFLDALSKSSQ